MKKRTVFGVFFVLSVVMGSVCMLTSSQLKCGAASAAPHKTKIYTKAVKNHSDITLPEKPGIEWPYSVALSPNGKWLAVVADNRLIVRNMKTGRWIWYFRDAYYSARWHPTKAVLIVPDGVADEPRYYMAYMSNGKKRYLFRYVETPFALIKSGMIWRQGTTDFSKSGEHGIVSRNHGYHIPWGYGDKAEMVYMSGGSNNQIAVELISTLQNKGGFPKWMEMYRKVPGKKQWLRSGKVMPEMRGKTTVWAPRKPTWLKDGRLLYLRIYPAQWAHLIRDNGILVPKALTAKNRAELWVCNANGTGQRRITTLWDLRLYSENRLSDWITIDKQGKNLYYISGKSIRHMSLAGKL